MKKALIERINNIKGVRAVPGFDLISISGDPQLYPLPLVEGNSKIGKVWHASTLPSDGVITAEIDGRLYSEVGTCPTTCRDESGRVTCYACRGNYLYNKIKYYLIMRTRLLRKYPDIYAQLAAAQIETEKVKYIRLHASGDFIDNEAALWRSIFIKYPYLKGWTYTKRRIAGDIKKLNDLKNFNIVRSTIPGCGFNYGHIDYLLKVYNKLQQAGKSVYICRCGIDKNQHCDTCGGCIKNDIVLFIEHGTGYNAKKDPLYNEIAAIINAQPLPLLDDEIIGAPLLQPLPAFK